MKLKTKSGVTFHYKDEMLNGEVIIEVDDSLAENAMGKTFVALTGADLKSLVLPVLVKVFRTKFQQIINAIKEVD
jgi:hypothetical protein